MYVDAVEGFCAPASYGDGEQVPYAAKYTIWKRDSDRISVDRKGATLQEAFKSF